MKPIAHVLATMLLSAAATVACADGYPEKPIRLVVPFPPGGTTDLLGRVLATRLSETLGQQVIVDNRPGAGGTIGSDAVAKAAPDGYTLMFGTVGTQSINGSLYKRLPFDTQKDFTPVALFAGVPNILVVNLKVPVHSVKELVAYAKSHPGSLNMGSAGNGTTNHLSGELFKSMTGAQIVHVPYKGSGPAMADLLANQVQIMFDNLPGSLPHVKAGKLRALAVTSTTRSPALPDVPTMAEAGVPGYVADVWFGVVGPSGLPKDVLAKLSSEITRIAQDKSMQDKLAKQGATPLSSTPPEFAARIRSDADKWAKLVRDSGATVD
ncbi:Bug family tripartite tricarboxylate transporter substrate binding protein [Cupriavidus basilensis]|uniref:Bug family tripartite tricarboxylate transporter substrate binding protein n=1 Tax=Cupriavidus basilensis TaxID=68895 RepID=UPI0020A669D7|nr:tripartite tricarboxylate transporter substrate binding protein [Cupriavidus basilensis]MCP3023642.1 tripartite tricarboxylate transporter substrate binding protein [Cupriavidus basilensis]